MVSTTERADARLRPRSAAPLMPATRAHPLRAPLTLAGRSAGALLRIIDAALAAWRSRREREAAICDLRSWNDWMLKDIGLTRGEIIAAVDGRLQRGAPEPKEENEPCDAPPRP